MRRRLSTNAISARGAADRRSAISTALGMLLCVGGFVLIFAGCEGGETARVIAIEFLKVLGGLALIGAGLKLAGAGDQ